MSVECFIYNTQTSVPQWVAYRTGCRCFEHRLGQYSFQVLMIGIATGFILLSQLPIGAMMVMWVSSQWCGKNITRSTGYMNSGKACICALAV